MSRLTRTSVLFSPLFDLTLENGSHVIVKEFEHPDSVLHGFDHLPCVLILSDVADVRLLRAVHFDSILAVHGELQELFRKFHVRIDGQPALSFVILLARIVRSKLGLVESERMFALVCRSNDWWYPSRF